MLRITTTQADKGNGTRIVAKGAGKQRTVPYDHSQSHNQNHAAAVVRFLSETQDRATVQAVKDRQNRWTHRAEGSKHVWEV